MQNDAYSNWLGAKLLDITEGKCRLSMVIRKEMLNGFNIAHGALTYALSDSALAFAANSYGNKAVSVDTSISHLAPVAVGDLLLANCRVVHKGRSIGLFNVEIFNQKEELVSFFKGTVKFSRETWA